MDNFILSAFGDEIHNDIKVQMDVLEKNNIKYIELRGVNGKNISDYTPVEIKEIAIQMQQRGFGTSAIGSPIGKIGILDDFAGHFDKFKNTLELAKILGTQQIRMFSFYIPKGEAPEKYRDAVLERWFKFIEAAKGYDLMLLHENEHAIYGESPECCYDLITSLNCPYVKAIFDPANFAVDGYDTIKAFDLLKELSVYLHIKDAIFKTHKIVPPGEGDGNVEYILKQLKKRDYKGFLSIEPHLAIGDIAVGGTELFEKAANALKNIINRI
ncbi:MAG: Xylose isomerase protein barrel [Clostridia bacterium]|nr:Xylose isomerase protein barrel [Clostridia bacterium]